MKNYLKKTEFILDLLYLYNHGNRYEGQGIMTWNPDEGFHLQAFLNEQKKPIEKVDLGRVQLRAITVWWAGTPSHIIVPVWSYSVR